MSRASSSRAIRIRCGGRGRYLAARVQRLRTLLQQRTDAVVARTVPASASLRRCADDPPRAEAANGERWRAGGREYALDAEDVAASDALSARLFHRTGGAGSEWIALTLQGYDYPSLGRCAALTDDGRCSVHADKPSICSAVPLDPMLPDRLQSRVLPRGATMRDGSARTALSKRRARNRQLNGRSRFRW